MTAPQTPRRPKKQKALPARYDRETSSSSKTHKWPTKPLHTRPIQQADILPDEDVGPGETHFYTSLIRYGPPPEPIAQTYGGQERAKPVASGSTASEKFSIGDTVLVVSTNKTPSVAVITALWGVVRNGDGGSSESMRIRVHWFVRPAQLGNTRRQRSTLPNEIYYSLANTAVLSPQDVIRKCHITGHIPGPRPLASPWPFTSKRTAEDEGVPEADRFVCKSAVDTQRGLFYEFGWEAHQDHGKASPPGDWSRWTISIAKDQGADTNTELDGDSPPPSPSKRQEPVRKTPARGRPPKKKARTKATFDDEEFEPEPSGSSACPSNASGTNTDTVVEPDLDLDLYDDPPKTPSKRKRGQTSATTTPRHKRVNNLAAPTPHSKAALRARRKKLPLNGTPPPLEKGNEHYERLQKLPEDPWLRAMHTLHVGAKPNDLPCRGDEYSKTLRSVLELIEGGSSGCVYIAGMPGMGKTATVHAVVRELKRRAESNELSPFSYVEINGLKIPEPHAAYNLLWQAISGHDVAADGHLAISSTEALKRLTKHFSGGASTRPDGHYCVVLMDELDQLLTKKQDILYNFFNWLMFDNARLILLAVANAMELPERVLTPRVRSRFGLSRVPFNPYSADQLQSIVHARLERSREGLPADATEVITKDAVKLASMTVSSVSGDARRVLDVCRRTVELARSIGKTAGIREVKEVISAMRNSPTAEYLRDLSLHERIMLAAVLKCTKRGESGEVEWGDVQCQHLIYASSLTGDDDPTRKPTLAEIGGVLDSLIASRAMLIEGGVAAQRKPAVERKVVLNLEPTEVERVLGEVGGQLWTRALGVS